MIDINGLAAGIRQRLAADERDALAGRGIFPRPGVTDDGAVCLHVKPGGNMAVTWYRNPVDGYKDMADLRNWADTENGWTRERVRADVAAKRRLLDLLLAEKHHVADDQWYTCPAATRERDGGTYAETDGGGRCSCGRDERVATYLQLLLPTEEA